MRAFARLGIALAIGSVAGCTLVNAPGDHRQPIPAEDFCATFAEVACRGHESCCANPVSPSECLEVMAQGCVTQFAGLAIDPRTGYSADAAARVFAEGVALVDACSLEISDWLIERDGFQSILEGSVEGGARCDEPGAANLAPIFSCLDDAQSCLVASGVWACAPRRRMGEACSISWDCEDGLFCSDVFRSGTCEPRLADGSLCARDEMCASLVCRNFQCAPRTIENVYCGVGE